MTFERPSNPVEVDRDRGPPSRSSMLGWRALRMANILVGPLTTSVMVGSTFMAIPACSAERSTSAITSGEGWGIARSTSWSM